MHLVTLATSEGAVAQRTELTHRQRQILKALELPELDRPPFRGQGLTCRVGL
jgi:hypothetical protein